MSTSRDRRERTQVDLYPEEQESPACQHALKERYHKQRWIMRRDQHVNVVSHVLEGGHTACARRALLYRPHQEEALARRGDTFGLEVVARRGARRSRDNWSITKLRGQLESESNLSISLKEVAWLGEVFLAWVTPGARQDQALIEPLSTVGRMVLSIDGVQPEKSYETLYILREGCGGRVVVAKTLLSRAPSEIEPLLEDGLA